MEIQKIYFRVTLLIYLTLVFCIPDDDHTVWRNTKQFTKTIINMRQEQLFYCTRGYMFRPF